MKIEKEIFSAATDSRFLREVTKRLTLDTEFANNLSLGPCCEWFSWGLHSLLCLEWVCAA